MIVGGAGCLRARFRGAVGREYHDSYGDADALPFSIIDVASRSSVIPSRQSGVLVLLWSTSCQVEELARRNTPAPVTFSLKL